MSATKPVFQTNFVRFLFFGFFISLFIKNCESQGGMVTLIMFLVTLFVAALAQAIKESNPAIFVIIAGIAALLGGAFLLMFGMFIVQSCA